MYISSCRFFAYVDFASSTNANILPYQQPLDSQISPKGLAMTTCLNDEQFWSNMCFYLKKKG